MGTSKAVLPARCRRDGGGKLIGMQLFALREAMKRQLGQTDNRLSGRQLHGLIREADRQLERLAR